LSLVKDAQTLGHIWNSKMGVERLYARDVSDGVCWRNVSGPACARLR
jgi:hypothetical protein